MNVWGKYIMFGLVVLFAGCTTVSGMRKAPSNKGVARTYNLSYPGAFDVALHACEILDFKISEKDFVNKVIIASEGMSLFSWGERIGIYFREISPTETEVRVVSKAKVKTHVLAPHWADDVHQAIETRILQLQDAKVKT